MTDPARLGYAGCGDSWAQGPMLVYGPLARHLVERCPLELDGATALDAGAGTGAATAELAARGASVIAVDLQAAMLTSSPTRLTAAVADVDHLPFRPASFDVVVAAFVLNHVADPTAGLISMARVTKRGGAILASSFSTKRAAAKNLVDDIAAAYGWTPPSWYLEIRERGAQVGTIDQLRSAAARAGLVDVEVAESAIDVGLDDPVLVARYRLGMPQLSGFVDSLHPRCRERFLDDVHAAITTNGDGLRPLTIELVARVT